tara:strand:+ start:3395 stop:3679 length:285 start_codon:yes stop_codon:yes gene_type:complete
MKWDIDFIAPETIKMSESGEIYTVMAYHLLHRQSWFHEPSHICGHCSMSFGEDTYCMLLKGLQNPNNMMTAVKCDCCGGTTTFDHRDLEAIHLW